MSRARRKSKTLNSHRRASSSLRYNLRKHQEFGKREPKKQKQLEPEESVTQLDSKELTLADIKEAFPGMHVRDALMKLAELRSAK